MLVIQSKSIKQRTVSTGRIAVLFAEIKALIGHVEFWLRPLQLF